MESLIKLLELASKYAFALVITLAAVIFVSDDTVSRMGLDEFRRQHRGILWLALIFSSAIAIPGLARAVWPWLWKYIFCPLLKLLFPIRDARSGIKQSRMRYEPMRIRLRNGESYDVYREISSNGIQTRFLFEHGERFVPPEAYDGEVINREFAFPSGARMDWADVFNGDRRSGQWAISEPV